MKTERKKKTLTRPNRLDAGNMLWAVGLILSSKPGIDDHDYLMSQHRSLVKALDMSMTPQARPHPYQNFSRIELENMIVLLEAVQKSYVDSDADRARVRDHMRKLKGQLILLHDRYRRH
jgi:hypothetical protein